jgi:hypothetical protein
MSYAAEAESTAFTVYPTGELWISRQSDQPRVNADWLPAPKGPVWIAMRLYWPKERGVAPEDQQFPSIGPTAPPGHETNWVQTVPGKGWNVIIRLYGPLQPWFDQTWKPGECELVRTRRRAENRSLDLAHALGAR